MNSILTTRKKITLIIVLIFIYFSQGQEQKQSTNITSEETRASEHNENQRLMTFSFALFNPITTKNSYIGQGTEGTLSYKLGTQVFIYKQFS